jgi:hypothetical protein
MGKKYGSGMNTGSYFRELRSFPSRILEQKDSGPASKNFSIYNPKKWFVSSRKYDLGCSSQIPDPDLDFYPSQIPDPKVQTFYQCCGSRMFIPYPVS